MTGIAVSGAQVQINALTGASVPVVASSAPTGIVGGYWINTSSGNALMEWNGSSWVAQSNNYLALLTADPTGLTTIAALTECGDSGYSRVAVSFAAAGSTAPVTASNNSLLTFGPFSVNMALPVQWMALVSVSSGTNGLLLDTFTISPPQQVSATQTINIAVGALQVTTS